jgi:hypothetical protein
MIKDEDDAGADVDVDVDLPIPSWEVRLKELADHREKRALQCSSTLQQKTNPTLGIWVRRQRREYRLHLEGKTSPMTAFHPSIESFRMDCLCAAWDERFELADHRKIHGHPMSPTTTVKHQIGNLGRKTKEQLQVAPRRKGI